MTKRRVGAQVLAGLAGCLLSVPPGLVRADQGGAALAPVLERPQGGRLLDLSLRQQWNANFGYCGEQAFLVAGLYFGQSMSQYEARAVASGSAPQREASSQLLLGVNDKMFAERSRLELDSWSGGSTSDFLAWIRGHILRKHPVIIGLYANQRRFDGHRDPLAGSPEYDHIVIVQGVIPRARNGAQAESNPTDWDLIFSDHGLLDEGLDGNRRFRVQMPFSTLPRSRAQANQADAPFYSLPSGTATHGVAVVGVSDRDHVTLPVHLRPGTNAETPEIADGSNQRPPGQPLPLTITVDGLRPGVPVRLYRYDSLAAIPQADFNAQARSAARQWSLSITSGSSVTLTDTVRSDQVAAYRAVPLSAP